MAQAGTPTKCPCGSYRIILHEATIACISLSCTFECRGCGFKGYYVPDDLVTGVYPEGSPQSKEPPNSQFTLGELMTIRELAINGLKQSVVPSPEKERLMAILQKFADRVELHRSRETWAVNHES